MNRLIPGTLAILSAAFLTSTARAETSGSVNVPLTQSNLNPKLNWSSPVDDSESYGLVLFDRLEYQGNKDGSVNWDLLGWHGGDIHRIWIKSEGSYALSNHETGQSDFQILYGRLVTPFFDFQAGARVEQAWGKRKATRMSGVLGLQGLSLYYFEIEASLFLAERGSVGARFTGTRDFLFSQKAIVQARLESSAWSKRSDDFEIGTGINDFSAGVRVRYEFMREVAPYVGINWTRLFGETAEFGRRGGGENSGWSAVAGIRVWY